MVITKVVRKRVSTEYKSLSAKLILTASSYNKFRNPPNRYFITLRNYRLIKVLFLRRNVASWLRTNENFTNWAGDFSHSSLEYYTNCVDIIGNFSVKVGNYKTESKKTRMGEKETRSGAFFRTKTISDNSNIIAAQCPWYWKCFVVGFLFCC